MWDALAPIIGWLGLGGVSVAGLIAAAYFLPGFRKLFIEIAAAIAGAMALYGKGVRDGSRGKQAQWDRAVEKQNKKSDDARARAEHDAANGVRDGFDRDKKGRMPRLAADHLFKQDGHSGNREAGEGA